VPEEIDYIKIKCEFEAETSNIGLETKLGHDELERSFRFLREQIRRDAVSGSYGNYSPAVFCKQVSKESFEKWDAKTVVIKCNHGDEDLKRGILPFEVRIASHLFSDARFGLQKIVHYLASDLFERTLPGINGQIVVKSLDLGAIRDNFIQAYRSKSHTIRDVKVAFEKGENGIPLLAFSIKPRTGLDENDYIRITTEALENGVDIVEMDTRDLPSNLCDWEDLVLKLYELALKISKKESKVRRFSANLSLPDAALGELPQKIADMHGNEPWVVKIDGNLDGMSLIQRLRTNEKLANQPIITCYPLLKYPLERYLGAGTFVDFLALSGADIIYPGGRPRIGVGRDIDSQHINTARFHYRNIKECGWPMPSIAGGVHAGQLHAMHALLGPDVAYFLGGGISLARDGVGAGAKLCSESLECAARLLAENKWDEREFQSKFAHIQGKYFVSNEHDMQEFQYVSPNILKDHGVDL